MKNKITVNLYAKKYSENELAKMIETKENEKKLMALIKCPVSAIYFAEIVQGLSTIAKSEGRTAFMRQTGDYMEIYSVLDKPQSRTQNDN